MKAPPYIHASLRVASEMALQIFGVGMLVCVICLSSFAQANNGRILGIITDQSGGATAGATITVTDTRKGSSRTLPTNQTGAYLPPNLLPGTYSVRAESRSSQELRSAQ